MTSTPDHPAAAGVTNIRPAGPDHQVVEVHGRARHPHRPSPCRTCPWRVDATGEFPAEAFRHSAPTAYDMSDRVFACHVAGAARPRPCAGFLLRGADHNLAARLMHLRGDVGPLSDGGHALHDSYRAMAVANGVDPDDPVLVPCRP
ncbi:DUF6283 family protein [Deinococcus sp. HMF7604]|uniref:DUF6283 family protein n=1 Tax=Deinococcus betulae TaxID=2873312 RepID=UPI001CCE055C|nr:DUF6283 family protein [Deinococcus betulae]MBZ9751788.1 DUF6283 family protein [Deinococcus betulae]